MANHGRGRSPIGLGYLIYCDTMLTVRQALVKAISRAAPAHDKPAETLGSYALGLPEIFLSERSSHRSVTFDMSGGSRCPSLGRF